MIQQRKHGLQSVLLLAQSILVTFSFVVCLSLTSLFTSLSWDQILHYPEYALAMTAGLVVELTRRQQSGKAIESVGDSVPAQTEVTLRQTVYAMGALFAFLVLTKDEYVSRISLVVAVPTIYATLLLCNRYLGRLLSQMLFQGVRRGRMILVGDPPANYPLHSWLRGRAQYGVDTVGILADQASPPIGSVPYLGTPDRLEALLDELEITQVMLLKLPDQAADYQRLMSLLEGRGVRLIILNNLSERLHHPVIYLEDEGLHFIALREEPLENPLNRIAKRTLDIVVSVPVILILLPIAALAVWILQRLYSPGPLFYRQVRAGLQNQEFVIWKFRTLHVNNPDAARQVTTDDPRIYRHGRFLRRFSIDELPQFWNVLRGQMSITGPRPHLVEQNEQFARQIARFPIRTVVKPGITGLAQVRGFRGEARTPEDIARRLESDLTYLENWRLSLDLSIMARTTWQMFFPPKTAY
jgi:exopolysaccharide biosynthesis polyprenyl glycosylphosphotransferase